jgi:hypothetical protein
LAGFDLERKEEVVRLGMEAIQEGKGELDYEKRRRGRESKRGWDRAPGKEREEGADRIRGKGIWREPEGVAWEQEQREELSARRDDNEQNRKRERACEREKGEHVSESERTKHTSIFSR